MVKSRDPYNSALSEVETIVLMSEGIPGAVTVIKQLYSKYPEDVDEIMSELDALNIRGSQIWIGFKDYSNQDLDKFKKSVLNNNKDMIKLINSQSGDQVPNARIPE